MSTINLPVIAPSLPAGYCWPSSAQTFANDLFAGAIVQFDITGYKGILVQSTTPTAAQRTGYAWYNTTTGRLLWYDPGQAAWVARHPEAPGGSVRRIFVGVLADIDTYDGGAVGAVGDAAGPMWERDTTFNDRAPFGVGTDIATVLSTGGVSSVSIAKANLPTDQLYVKTSIVGQASVGTDVPVVNNTYGSDAVSGTGRAVDSTSSDFSGRYYTRGQTEALGSGTALSVQNKYVGVYFVKRTARIYYSS